MIFSLKLAERKTLAPRVFELAFLRPEGLTYRPGQHLRFQHQGFERDYTPVSLAGEETIRICVRQRAEPGFSAFLGACDSAPGPASPPLSPLPGRGQKATPCSRGPGPRRSLFIKRKSVKIAVSTCPASAGPLPAIPGRFFTDG